MNDRAILLTGWEGMSLGPNVDNNPSGIIAHNLHEAEIEGHTVESAILSLDLKKNRNELSDLLQAKPRAACVSIGVMSIHFFRLEPIGVNEIDTDLLPQYAVRGHDTVPLIKSGLDAYTNTTLDVERVAADMEKDGFETRVNNRAAGRVNCNGVVCCQLDLAPEHPNTLFLFGHIPFHPELAAYMNAVHENPVAGMDLGTIQQGVISMIASVARQRQTIY